MATIMTYEQREELRRTKVNVFEVAEFIKAESAYAKEVISKRNCSVPSVTARVIEALKQHEDLKEYNIPDECLSVHITVAIDSGLLDCYDIIWSDAEGNNTIIGTWLDASETMLLRIRNQSEVI